MEFRRVVFRSIDKRCSIITLVIGRLLHVVLQFFFFSSRRRHTRFDCDWSSDVCSSDLERGVDVQAQRAHGRRADRGGGLQSRGRAAGGAVHRGSGDGHHDCVGSGVALDDCEVLMRVVIRTFQTAMRALRRNVTRSALTCLGIIIGIAAVIAMMEIGNGVSALNEKAIASLGANNLMVQPGSAASGGISWGSGSVMTLTPEDCEAILRDCPAVRAAAPTVRTGSVQAVYGNRNWVPNDITGSTAAYLDVREWPLAEGEVFTEQDVRSANRVCVIGQIVKRELFGEEDPIGKELRMGSVSMRVMGVLARKGANMFGRDQDDVILAPWTTIKYRISNRGDSGGSQQASGSSGGSSSSVNTLKNPYPNMSSIQLYPQQSETEAANYPRQVRFANISTIMAAARSQPEIPVAMKQITDVLRERHRIREGELDDFNIRDMTELSDTLGKSTALIGTLLLVVAGISLVVGGVGIMNIMLVSVTERTK